MAADQENLRNIMIISGTLESSKSTLLQIRNQIEELPAHEQTYTEWASENFYAAMGFLKRVTPSVIGQMIVGEKKDAVIYFYSSMVESFRGEIENIKNTGYIPYSNKQVLLSEVDTVIKDIDRSLQALREIEQNLFPNTTNVSPDDTAQYDDSQQTGQYRKFGFW